MMTVCKFFGTNVSWQMTGIHRDPWANAHQVLVEQDKSDKDRGLYLYSELYGQLADRGTSILRLTEGLKAPLMTKNR